VPFTSFLQDSHPKTLLLDGWTVSRVEPGRSPHDPETLKDLPAQVPGCIHLDLMRQGLIPDPFEAMNEKEVAWVADQDWVYRTTLTLAPEDLPVDHQDRLQLVFEGIDTVAEVRLDNKLLARTDNMFVPYRIDLPRGIKAGKHELEVDILSPVEAMRLRVAAGGRVPSALEDDRGWIRKAQYSYGWDWGPILPTSGIFRPVYLQKWRSGRFSWFTHRFDWVEGKAMLYLTVSMALEQKGEWAVSAHLHRDGSEAFAIGTVRPDHLQGKYIAQLALEVENPSLWWPHDAGDPAMYNLDLTLSRGDDVVHEVREEIGLRTVEWVREQDTWGESFALKLNGRLLYAKGAKWIPTDSLLPRAEPERYERQVALARDANMNMLRVWGGGLYEDPSFYRAADRMGVMIWQDFPFACAFYPDTPEFLLAVRQEAESAVGTLARHPSIVLWCGNNEIERDAEEFKKMWDVRYLGEVIWKSVLPEVVERMAPGAPYWQSSPDGGSSPNADDGGDRHVWSVWSGWESEDAYLREEGRFISEFGFQAPPDPATLREVVPEEAWHPQHAVVEWHNKQIEGPERLVRFLAARHRITDDLDRFIRLSQDVQGSALRKALEHWRRRRPRTMGSIIWQLNDCWQVASWSLIDYHLRPKASFYQVKRAYAPRALTLLQGRNGVELWAVNDTAKAWKGDVHLQALAFGIIKTLFSFLYKRNSIKLNT